MFRWGAPHNVWDVQVGTPPDDEPEHATDKDRQHKEGFVEGVVGAQDEGSDEEEQDGADDGRHDGRHHPGQEDRHLRGR